MKYSAKNLPSAARLGTDGDSRHFDPPPRDSISDDFTVLDVWGFLLRRKVIIAACVGLISIVSASLIFQLPSQYAAEALVTLDFRQQNTDVQSSLPGMPIVDMSVVRTEVDIIRSPTIAAGVVKKLNLTKNPEFNSAMLAATPRAQITDSITKFFGVGPKAPVAKPDEATLFQRTVDTLIGKTSVINDGRSYVLRIRIVSGDPQLAADIANAYTEVYFVSQLESKFETVRRSNEWLNENLSEMRDKVETSARAVQNFIAENNLSQNNGTTVIGQQVAELNSQLTLAAINRAQKEASLTQLQRLLKTGGIDNAAPVLSSAMIQDLRKREAELALQEAQMATKYRPAHPARIDLAAQAKDLRQKITDETNKIAASLESDVASARANETVLREALAGIQQTATAQSAAAPRLQELERQANADRVLYENFLSRFKQTSTQQNFQQADARLISAATAPLGPFSPRKSLLLGLSISGAVLFGLFAAFCVERLDVGFRTAEHIERLTGVSTMGLVPELKTQELESVTDFIVRHPTSPFAEALRTIRTALRYTAIDNPPKVVLITSAMPEEGKSLFSLSLAASIAHSGRKVLLVECDMRRPTMAKKLHFEPKASLLLVLDDEAMIDTAIHIEKNTGVHILPATATATNSQDILGSARMESLIKRMRSRYDMIILDSPPALAVSDALVLSHVADAVLFLVRWGETPRRSAVDGMNSFHSHGRKVSGVVLSRVNVDKYSTYGRAKAGYYYGADGNGYAPLPTKS